MDGEPIEDELDYAIPVDEEEDSESEGPEPLPV
jgi:hypothetical protein